VAPVRRASRWTPLDGLRGIAVLLVMAFHEGALPNGYLGVDIFFPLSGFLITGLLWEEWDRYRVIDIRAFYRRRARRLLPALLIVVALFVAVLVVLDPFPGLRPVSRLAASTLLFASNGVCLTGHAGWLGGLIATWTLAQEAQFYLIWPLVLLWLLARHTCGRSIALLLGFSIPALLLADMGLLHALHYSDYFSPLNRATELMLGCLAAIAWQAGLVPRIFDSWWISPLALAGLIGLVGLGYVARDARIYPEPVYLGAAACAGVLILGLLRSPDTSLARALSWRPLVYVGTISYCLYLCHGPIIMLAYEYVPGRSALLDAAIAVPVSFAVAVASWRLLESRVLGRSRAPLRGTRPRVPVS
jgi:peptidoglycan/LPS O-acetylase OafA/YrhL